MLPAKFELIIYIHHTKQFYTNIIPSRYDIEKIIKYYYLNPVLYFINIHNDNYYRVNIMDDNVFRINNITKNTYATTNKNVFINFVLHSLGYYLFS